jgi:hypothetical protein
MEVAESNDFLTQAFLLTISNDYNKFITSLYLKYGENNNFTLDDLYKKYPLDKIIFNSPKKVIISRKHKNATESNRCAARCWGGYESVKYNKSNKTWNFGHRCPRNKSNDKDYCLVHYNQIIKNRELSHGRIDEEPPHNHYRKYQIRYSILHNIPY